MLYAPHKPHINDTLSISLVPTKISPSKIASMYLNEGLSTGQIAERLDLAKSTVLSRLHSIGIGKGQNPELEAQIKAKRGPSTPAYGLRKLDGQLAPCKREIKICRLIIDLIDNENFSYRKTAREMEARNIKNRKGHASWNYMTVKAIYQRWGDKLLTR